MFSPSRPLKRKKPSTAPQDVAPHVLECLYGFDQTAFRAIERQNEHMQARHQQAAAAHFQAADAILAFLCQCQQKLQHCLAQSKTMLEKNYAQLLTELGATAEHLKAASVAADTVPNLRTIVEMLVVMHLVEPDVVPRDYGPVAVRMLPLDALSAFGTVVSEPVDPKVSFVKGQSWFVPGMPAEVDICPCFTNGEPATYMRETDIVLEFKNVNDDCPVTPKDVSYKVLDAPFRWRVQYTFHNDERARAIRLAVRIHGAGIGKPQTIRTGFSARKSGGQLLERQQLQCLAHRIAINRTGTRLAVLSSSSFEGVVIYSLPDTEQQLSRFQHMITPSGYKVYLENPVHIYFTDVDRLLITDARANCVYYCTQRGVLLDLIPFTYAPTFTTGHGNLFATVHARGIDCFTIQPDNTHVPALKLTADCIDTTFSSPILFVDATKLWVNHVRGGQRQIYQYDVSTPLTPSTPIPIYDCYPHAMTQDGCVLTTHIGIDNQICAWTMDGRLIDDAPLSLRSRADDSMIRVSSIAIVGGRAYVQAGQKIPRPSEMYSSATVCIYVFGTADEELDPIPLVNVPCLLE